jgi:hypothetical protein
MPFIGNTPDVNFTSFAKQDLTGVTGSPAKTGFTLTHAVANANEIEVFVNNVRQEPTESYTVSGTGLTMTGDVETTDDFYIIYLGKALQTTVPPDGSVSSAKIADGAVSSAKIANSAVDLTSKVTGVLPVANGGTGHSALIAFACRRNPSSGDVSLNDDIVFNNVQVNIGSAYNNSNGRFTAPVAGTYLFSFYAIGCGASAGELPANQTVMGYFKKNGSDAGYGWFQSRRASSGYPNIAGTIVITLAEDDYVQVHISTNFIYTSAGANYNNFSGHLIG